MSFVLENAFFIPKRAVKAAKMVIPVMRKEAAKATSCLLRVLSCLEGKES
jgi:hypothetical protein